MAFRAKPLSAAACLVATAMMAAQPASAAGLLDILFGGGVKRQQPSDFPPAPPKPKKKAAVAAPKISAPAYYDYRVDPMTKVAFAELVEAPRPASVELTMGGVSFDEALAGLDGFDLAAEQDIAKALVAYYRDNRNFIWVTGYGPNERAAEALRVLADAGSYGLSPSDYSIAVPPAGFSMDAMPARLSELVRFEMTMSARVLRYVRDAYDGRIDPNRISGYHDFPPKPVDLTGVLTTLAHTQDVKAFLESRHPQNPEYQALRVELEALEASAENDIVVDPGLMLKPGQTSPELPKLLTLIGRKLDPVANAQDIATIGQFSTSELYVPELVQVIKDAQSAVGLKPDGVVGPRTVAELAGSSKADRIAKVTYALEQLRWHPSDLGSPRVFINQPAFTASYIEGDKDVLTMRAVIGKPSNQTSFFYDEIEQVDYNPYWGVPQSIIVNEMLPRLRSDPGYLDRAGYEVTDAQGKRISSASVNWGAYGSKVPFGVRQSPSEANALGELKILFPNKHAIYMHDTPQKALFDRDSRAFSHGCVRLQNPRGMAAAVLGTSVDYVAEKLKEGHSSEKVTRKIPVYVAYFTAWPDASGKVAYFTDVYDRDSRLQAAMDKTSAARAPAS
ncbi:MAG: murein L,D-transpeptidase [Rhizobiaceae bacterium]|nr:murein L,D-transpeptidase [Rhizobiaceae bacterium]